jgi:DNA repair photolyase
MSIIYEPKGRAREYAALACNVYNGCDHRCKYCYAKRLGSHEEPRRRSDLLGKLEREIKSNGNGLAGKTVHLCFTCDAYQNFDIEVGDTRGVIQMTHAAGGGVAVLTKGGSRALRDIDLMIPGRDYHAATLTFLNGLDSLEWEPGAALPQDRIDTLKLFDRAGIDTWVSLEPVIDPVASIMAIHETVDFVGMYKVGKMNYHPIAKEIDWRRFATTAVDCLEGYGFVRSFSPDTLRKGQYYIKRDLAAYLK